MSWVRSITIAPKTLARTVSSKLKKTHLWKALHDNGEYVLFVCEGRDEPEFDAEKTLTLSVDGRSIFYSINGNPGLAKIFHAQVRLTVGISFRLSSRGKLPSKAKAIVKKLEAIATSYSEEDEDEDRYGIRVQASPEEAKAPMELIATLTQVLDKRTISYRATSFDGAFGEDDGDLEDVGLWIGPGAYVIANWQQRGVRKHNFELVLNGEETLLNGNSLRFGASKSS